MFQVTAWYGTVTAVYTTMSDECQLVNDISRQYYGDSTRLRVLPSSASRGQHSSRSE